MSMLHLFKRFFTFLFDILQTIVFALAIFVVIYLFAAQPHQVKGASMEPNFHDGEYILTEKITYRIKEPRRGEVIIFKAPNKPEIDYIKRIVVLPHERIRITSGTIYINGQPLKELYEPISIKNSAGRFLREGEEYTLPSGSYFVLGDNRSHSSDSREFGFIKKETIIGRAIFRYWPLNRLGTIKTPFY